MSADKQRQLAEIQKQQEVERIASVEMPSAWKVSDEALEGIKYAVSMAKLKHGLYASIPMYCKGKDCPYGMMCPNYVAQREPNGERCPVEIAMILTKFEDYKSEFGIDETNIVDMNLTKDLIDCDIQIFRAENKMALDGDFIENYVVTVTEGGEAIEDTRISKAAEYKDKVAARKHKILNMMNSTRKDKVGDKMTVSLDPSSYASQLMSQIAGNMKPGQIIDADYDEVDDE